MVRNRKGNRVWKKSYSAFVLWTECDRCHKEFRWEYMYYKIVNVRDADGGYMLCKHCITNVK